jgi:hypothetical protein
MPKNKPTVVKQQSILNQSEVDQQHTLYQSKVDQLGTSILHSIKVSLENATDVYNKTKKQLSMNTELTEKYVEPVLARVSNDCTKYKCEFLLYPSSEFDKNRPNDRIIEAFEYNEIAIVVYFKLINYDVNIDSLRCQRCRDNKPDVESIVAVWTRDSITVFGVNYNISTKFTLEQQDELVEHLTIQLKAFSS